MSIVLNLNKHIYNCSHKSRIKCPESNEFYCNFSILFRIIFHFIDIEETYTYIRALLNWHSLFKKVIDTAYDEYKNHLSY